MLDSSAVVGFVENSPGTDDLQAWCDACEAMFVEEGGMTERFLAFNGFSVVCADCFARLRTLHVKH